MGSATRDDTPGVDHAGNYTGARLSLPPGALAPETVAKAVVRLATRPRHLTAIGAPALGFKLGEFVAPNVLPAIMSGFLDRWADRTAGGAETDGALFEPGFPAGADGGRRDPRRARKAVLAAGSLAVVGLAGAGIWLRRRGRACRPLHPTAVTSWCAAGYGAAPTRHSAKNTVRPLSPA